ncbi:putative aspartic protease, partial [Mucuna pruriens]
MRFVLVLYSLSIASFAEATKSVRGLSIDLIHRDSPLSPFYNTSLTPSERIKNAALRTIARSNRVGHLVNAGPLSNTITISDENLAEYLMRFYIGTPPMERFGIADTGSDLIWVQCSPCKKCIPQDNPLFDPRKSSTFKTVPCDSQPCTLLSKNQHACARSGECLYEYHYADKSFTSGKLGVDFINFGSKGGGKVATFHKLTFGCGFYNNETVAEMSMPKNTGLVGLGAGPLSLISQLGDEIGHKFSYCLLPFYSNSTSKLIFGSEAMEKVKRVFSTPLILKPSLPPFYFLNLEGISVGKKKVKTIKRQTEGNMVIDSGTPLTILEQGFYHKLVTLVKEVMGVKETKQKPSNAYHFCFKYDTDAEFPDFVFHFTGTKVRVNPQNIFDWFGEDLFCMSMHPTSEHGFPILGSRVQVGFRVEYDLKRGKLSFAPTDCIKN